MKFIMAEYAQKIIQSLLFAVFGIYLLLAFLTYSPYDPGWTQLASDTRSISNFCGPSGAWIVDLLKGFLGFPAVMVSVYLLLEATHVWYPYGKLNSLMRWIAQVFCLVGCSALFGLYALNTQQSPTHMGGIIGYEIATTLSPVLSPITSTMILCALLLVLATLAFGLNWSQILRDIRQLFRTLYPSRRSPLLTPSFAEGTGTLKAPFGMPLAPSPPPVPVFGRRITPQPQLDPSIAQLFAHFSAPAVLAPQPSSVEDMTAVYMPFPAVDVPAADLPVVAEAGLPLKVSPPFSSARTAVSGETHAALNHPARADDQFSPVSQQAATGLVEEGENSAYDPQYMQQSATHSALLSALTPAQSQPLSEGNLPAGTIQAQHDQMVQDDEMSRYLDRLEAGLGRVQPLPPVVHAHSALEPTENAPESLAPVFPEQTVAYADSDAGLTDIHPALVPDHVTPSFDPVPVKPVPLSAATDLVVEAAQSAAEVEQDTDPDTGSQAGGFYSHAFATAAKRKTLSPLPGLELLDLPDPNARQSFSAEELQRLSKLLEIKLQEFNIKAQVVEAQPGPVVTRFEIDLAPGIKASKVTGISRDLARSMSMPSVRVVEVIPGKPYIGIEVPNHRREMVRLIELLKSDAYRDPKAGLSMAMGKDIAGQPVLTDMAKTPHMLVAGTTGSGKSVAVNAMLLSLLLKYQPDHLRLILIDPKQLELANYGDIPHLLTPVVTDMKDAISALTWCVAEMERRYKLMSIYKVRKIDEFNRKVLEAAERGEPLFDPLWRPGDTALQERAPQLTTLPFIVIVADEFADLIMQVGKKAEELITRLAQKARAAGIHLLLATQRPSVDVITGLIKANIPTRVALRVNSKIDSRTILDAGGAEDMLGHGDMLFLGPGKNEPERVHGAFISDDEVNRICEAWRERGSPDYVDDILSACEEEGGKSGFSGEGDMGSDPEKDPMYDQVVSFVLETRKVSASMIQRKFSLGYNRAARIVDQMEMSGVISAMNASGKRDILV